MIHFVIGTRAQLFKMAPVMRECEKQGLSWRWIYTAQHKDTIKESLDTFGLPEPDFTVFEWDTEAKTMGKIWYWFVRIMIKLLRGRSILGGYTGKNHIVLTHGDTLSTWWGALLGKIFGCKVMHVEAGLRSHNLFHPFPEEINRIITSWLSNYYICPGQSSVDNLKNYRGKKINTVYNTQADTIAFGIANCDNAQLDIPPYDYAVVSLHRYENIFNEDRFKLLIKYLDDISSKIALEFVLHPATEQQLNKYHLLERLKNNPSISTRPRLEYLPFIKLIKNSEFVITDGGGNQEELYFIGKPTLLFRDATERPEELGKTAVLSHYDQTTINNFVENYNKYQQAPIEVENSPSTIIVAELASFG